MIVAPEILGRLEGVRETANGWEAHCPAHEDRRASLSMSQGADGTVLLKCHAGCSTKDVMEAVGLTLADLFPKSPGNGHHTNGKATNGTKAKKEKRTWPSVDRAIAAMEYHKGPVAARWDYHSTMGELVGVVLRWNVEDGSKDFRPLTKITGGWQLGQMPAPRPLYRLPDLLKQADRLVPVFEGEKCCDFGRKLGLCGTTSAGGAEAPHKTDFSPLAGRQVAIFPDNDCPGEKYARTVAAMLGKLTPPASVKIVRLPGLGEGGDVCDFMESAERLDDIRAEIERLVNETPAFAPEKPTPTPEPRENDQPEGAAHLTDLGNARRVIKRHGEDLHYVHSWKSWSIWDGARWGEDKTAEPVRRVKETIGWFYEQCVERLKALQDASDDDEEAAAERARVTALLKHAIKWEDARAITRSLELARSEPGIPLLPEDLDRDQFLLNVLNGTIDLRTGRLRPHRREDLLTKLARVAYDPRATCPLWDRFLYRVMDGKKSLVDYLQRVVGYGLTGLVIEQCLWFLYGEGANGKSTFLITILALMGDYAMQAVSDLLIEKKNESHPTERADLFGKRFVATIETESGKRVAEALMKQLTGGDKVRARKMKQDFFEFDSTFKIFLAANHKPVIRGRDHGAWRRIKLVPFTVTIPDHEKDKDLAAKLKNELPGILNWAIRGCLDWQAHGLCEPDEVRQAGEAYRAEQDVVERFLAERCYRLPEGKIKVSTLYEVYGKWSGDKHTTQPAFNDLIRAKGYASEREKTGYWWWGISLGSSSPFEQEAFAGEPG